MKGMDEQLKQSRIKAISMLHLFDREVNDTLCDDEQVTQVADHMGGKVELDVELEKYNRYDTTQAFNKVLVGIKYSQRTKITKRILVITSSVVAVCAILFVSLMDWDSNKSILINNIAVDPVEVLIPLNRLKAELSDTEGNRKIIDAQTNEIILGDDVIKNDAGNATISYMKINPSYATINTIHIPKKGIYRLILQDSTIVTLNSDSYLEYPTAFTGATREVRLVGEALFEVKRDVNRPFKVKTESGDVLVLGTVFNVKNYPNEEISDITLLNGSVVVNNNSGSVQLTPREKAVINKTQHSIQKQQANMNSVVAWLKNQFDYTDAPLQLIVNDLIRCYDVNIEIVSPGLGETLVTFYLSKNNDIDTVMDILQQSKMIHVSKVNGTYLLK